MTVGIIRSVDLSTYIGIIQVCGQIVFLVGVAASNSLVVLGSIAMLRQRRHGLATVAAVVACIPICSPFYLLGLPFGIWATLLLRRPEVKARFS